MGYPLQFIDNVICTFEKTNTDDQNKVTDDNDDNDCNDYFTIFLLKLPFCQKNEVKSKHFLEKIPSFYEN